MTALYTAGTWAWAEFPEADLYHTFATHRVFGGVNRALTMAGWLSGETSTLKYDLAHRHAVLDAVVRCEAPTQVLELAAGLSPRGAAFTSRSTVRWVEVDLPAVVAYKESLLEQTEAGKATLARGHLSRVAADVTVTELQDLLPAQPNTVVLTEGLLMYLDAQAQQALWARIADYLAPVGGVLAFDLVPSVERPAPSWVARALGATMKRFTGGVGFEEDSRTREHIAAELKAAGFDDVQIVVPHEVAKAWSLPYPEVVSTQVVFVATKRAAA